MVEKFTDGESPRRLTWVPKTGEYRVEKVCGIDDGSTVCVLPKGHPIPHQSADGRRFLYPED